MADFGAWTLLDSLGLRRKAEARIPVLGRLRVVAMMRYLRNGLWLTATVGVGWVSLPACTEGCTEELAYGLSVRVKSEDTGAPLCGATVIATSGTYTETLQGIGGPDCIYFGAPERPGTYRIEVNLDGYLPAVVSDVTVKSDDCHVIPEVRTVTLTPGTPECFLGDLFACSCPGGGSGTSECLDGKIGPCTGC